MHTPSLETLRYEKSTTWPNKKKLPNKPRRDTLTVKEMKESGLASRVRIENHMIKIGLLISRVSGKNILSNKRKKLS